jgi:hypothetical protein
MTAKPSEYFHQSIVSLYKEMIQEALLESEVEGRTRLDESKLHDKLEEIEVHSKVDGLSHKEIKFLIDEAVTDWDERHKVSA